MTCPISTPTCGVYESCGQLVDCGICTFGSSAPLPYMASNAGAFVSAPGGSIEMPYVPQTDQSTIHVAHFSAGTWTDEVALALGENDSPSNVELAISSNGSRWLEYSLTNTAYIASASEGGAWGSGVQLPGRGPIAVGSDGTPWLAYINTGGAPYIYVASPSGSGWTSTLIQQIETTDTPLVAVSGAQPIVLIPQDDGGPLLAQFGGSGWTTTPVPVSSMFFDGTLLLAVDSDHIAVVSSEDDGTYAYELAGTTWTTTALPQLTEDLLPDEINVDSATYDTHGTLWIATGGDGAYLVNVTPDGAPIQRILQTAGGVTVLPDPVNGVMVVEGGEVLTRTGDISSASASTCAEFVSSLCKSACSTCITGGPCGWAFSATTGDSGNTYGSAVDCEFSLTATMCGNLDAAGSALDACETAVPTTTCVQPGAECTDGCVDFPSACASLY